MNEQSILPPFMAQQIADTIQATENERQDFSLFALLKPKIVKDGNQWCVLYGEDLQIGIAGFGDRPIDAIRSWNNEWYKQENGRRS